MNSIEKLQVEINNMKEELERLKNQKLVLESIEDLQDMRAKISIAYYDGPHGRAPDLLFVYEGNFVRVKMARNKAEQLHQFLVKFIKDCVE